MKRSFKLLVAYENPAGHAPALQLWECLNRRLEPAFDLDCTFWDFDLVESLRDAAVSEASGVDMILVSASRGTALPEAVQHWLQRCIAPRSSTTPTLVAVFDCAPGRWGREATVAPSQTLSERSLHYFGRADAAPDRIFDGLVDRLVDRGGVELEESRPSFADGMQLAQP